MAVRIRPIVQSELEEGCLSCLQAVPGQPQVVLGGEKAFTFDLVFPPEAPQVSLYEDAALPLLSSFFQGMNATVLAYGQTGSGKTFTMGTNAAGNPQDDPGMGLIPRMVREIFRRMDAASSSRTFSLNCSFLEIHKEEIRDLLDPVPGKVGVSVLACSMLRNCE